MVRWKRAETPAKEMEADPGAGKARKKAAEDRAKRVKQTLSELLRVLVLVVILLLLWWIGGI